jgi:hypothetical protein
MKKTLETVLAKDVLRVYFTKKDKSERAMVCTLDERKIPANQRAAIKPHPRKDLVTVWDLETKVWRNIPVDNVTGVEKVQDA